MKKCGAKTKSNEPCRKTAGWGTSHKGFGYCKLHEESPEIQSLNEELIKAVQNNDIELVHELLERGASSNTGSLLVDSAQENQSEITKLLLRYDADPNQKNSENQTPLMYAVSYDDFELVSILIESGAKIDIIDNGGNTVFNIAEANKVSTNIWDLLNTNNTYNEPEPSKANENNKSELEVKQKISKKKIIKNILLFMAILLISTAIGSVVSNFFTIDVNNKINDILYNIYTILFTVTVIGLIIPKIVFHKSRKKVLYRGLFLIFIISGLSSGFDISIEKSSNISANLEQENETNKIPATVEQIKNKIKVNMEFGDYIAEKEKLYLVNSSSIPLGNGIMGSILEGTDGIVLVNTDGKRIIELKEFSTIEEVNQYGKDMIALESESNPDENSGNTQEGLGNADNNSIETSDQVWYDPQSGEWKSVERPKASMTKEEFNNMFKLDPDVAQFENGKVKLRDGTIAYADFMDYEKNNLFDDAMTTF